MDREIEKYCKYCEKAQALYDSDTMLCPRYGVVSATHKCRKFKYDPLKRVPPRPAKLLGLDLTDEDFSL